MRSRARAYWLSAAQALQRRPEFCEPRLWSAISQRIHIILSRAGSIQARDPAPFVLTARFKPRNIKFMAHSYLIFNFGTNEETAQHARHRIEGWRQAFHLDKKVQLKFDRKETEPAASAATSSEIKPAKSKSKASSKEKAKPEADASTESAASAEIRVIVRLDFSDHEKLSHKRWVERIPAEEPFKDANPEVVHSGDAAFAATEELFERLD